MSLAQKVTKAVSWLALAQVAQRATTLVVTAILARKLTPEDFGLIALTLLSVNFVSYFQEMGLSAALVQRKVLEDDHLVTAFWLNIAAGFALALLGCGSSPLVASVFREPRLTPLLIVMMLTLPINGSGWASNALLQRNLLFRQISLIEWIAVLFSGTVAVVFAVSGAGVWSLVAQNLSSSVVLAVGRIFAARWLPRLYFSVARARELSSFSLSAFGYFVVNHGMRNVDNAIIGGFLGTAALGYYALAYNLILMPGMTVCGIVGRVMFPALSSVQDDLARFRGAYLRMARTITTATFPLIAGLAATAPLFITTIYGQKWTPAIPLLHILVVIGACEAVGIWGTAVWALGKTKITFFVAIASFVLMTVAFSVGVKWGLTGVAWAYVFISPVIFVLPHLIANRLMNLKLVIFVGAIAPPLCAATLMAVVIALLISRGVTFFSVGWINLLSFITLGAAIYGSVLLFLAIALRGDSGVVSWLIGRDFVDLRAQPQRV